MIDCNLSPWVAEKEEGRRVPLGENVSIRHEHTGASFDNRGRLRSTCQCARPVIFKSASVMNDSESESEKITIELLASILKHVDRIATEKKLSRDKVINDILKNHFSGDASWIEDIIQ